MAARATKNAKSNGRTKDRAIKVLKANPRRKGTGAHKHFEIMSRSPTVQRYFTKFKPADRKNAAAYLYSNVRQGYAKFVDLR